MNQCSSNAMSPTGSKRDFALLMNDRDWRVVLQFSATVDGWKIPVYP
jgi:hypothetical protein